MITNLTKIKSLRENPKVAIKVNKILSDLGFKNILYKSNFDIKIDLFNKLTLVINPYLDENYSYNLRDLVKEINGYVEVNELSIFKNSVKDDIKIKIKDIEVVIGRYLKNNNCLIFYYPIFNTDLKLGEKNET